MNRSRKQGCIGDGIPPMSTASGRRFRHHGHLLCSDRRPLGVCALGLATFDLPPGTLAFLKCN